MKSIGVKNKALFNILNILLLFIVTLYCAHCGIALLPVTLPASLAISAHNESVKRKTLAMLKDPNMLDEAMTKEENVIIDNISDASDSKKIENAIFELTPYIRKRVNRHQFSRALEMNGVLMDSIKKHLHGNIGKLANCKLWEAKINYITNAYDKSINSCKQLIDIIGQMNTHDIEYFMNITTKDETYILLGYNYLAKGNLKEAEHYFEKFKSYADVISTVKQTIKTTNYNYENDEEPTTTFKTITSTKKEKKFVKHKANNMIDLRGGLVDYYLATGNPKMALELLEEQREWKPTFNMKDMMEGQLKSKGISFFDFQIYWHFRRALAMEALGQGQEAAKSAIEAIFLLDNVRFAFPLDTSTAVLQGYRSGLFIDYYKAAIRIMADQFGKNSNDDNLLNDVNILVASFLCAEIIKAQNLIGSVIERAREYSPPQISKELALKEQKLLNQYWNIEHSQGSFSWSSQDNSYITNRINIYQNYINNLRAFIDELYSKDPNYAMIYYPRPLMLNEIPLHNDEILIEYLISKDCIYRLKLEKIGQKANGYITKIAYKPEELKRDIDKLIKLSEFPRGTDDEYIFIANKLYNNLLSDLVDNLSGRKKIIIVPDGILGLIPFEALIVKKGTGFRDAVFLSDNYLITYCQSASFLALIRKYSPHSHPSKTLFALGNPSIEGKRPIKGSDVEVRKIADIFGVKQTPPDIILGSFATKSEINKTPLKDYRYLHFATHCEIKKGSPCLFLSNENKEINSAYLEIGDIMDWELNADMVVLSACLTGRGKNIDGEGLVNFAWAFHYAGAKSVIITMWEIDGDITKEFMVMFYNDINNRISPIQALKNSRHKIRKKYANPHYWAPFILHGEG